MLEALLAGLFLVGLGSLAQGSYIIDDSNSTIQYSGGTPGAEWVPITGTSDPVYNGT